MNGDLLALHQQIYAVLNLIILKNLFKFDLNLAAWREKKYDLQQIRLSTAEFAEFDSKIELLNGAYIWHHLIHWVIVEFNLISLLVLQLQFLNQIRVAKMKQTRHICGTTLYNCIFLECNVSNNDDKLETHDIFLWNSSY